MKAALNEPCEEDRVQRKPVVGYEGLYEVTADGRVLSVARNSKNGTGAGKNLEARWKTLIVTQPQGYISVQLWKDNKNKMVRVHRLVAEAFLGIDPEGLHIDHKDRDVGNNHFSNLRYVTRSMNNHNTRAKGYCWTRGGWMARITIDLKEIYLGRFSNEEDARDAYIAAKKHYGVYTP